jgi:thermolabile hemolysin
MRYWVCIVLLCFSVALPLAAAPSFDAIYVFGDSLSDTGNEPAEPVAHYQGRWSNGPLWIEHLSTRLGLSYIATNNFARSGAQCDDAYAQTLAFTPPGNVSQSLFVVWAGGNDFLQEYDQNGFSDSKWNQQTTYSASSIGNAVNELYAKGARHILVPNTVDVTEIPTLNYLPEFLRSYLRGKVSAFNSKLATQLNAVHTAHPDLQLYRCDTFARLKSLLGTARQFGFTEWNIDVLADVTLFDKSFNGPGSNYVFWDPIHPTTKAHGIIADWFLAVVAPMKPGLVLTQSGGGLGLTTMQVHAGRDYLLQSSTNLTAWTDVTTFLSITNHQPLSIPAGLPKAFYRLKWLD